MSEMPNEKHLDEMTLLLYVERQLDRAHGLEVSAHTQECDACRTLLRALERESRLLTRAMLEEDEPLPSRLAQFQERARKSMQWIWGLVFGLAATGVYALYTGYIQPWQQQLEAAGFGGSNLLGLLIFQGAVWKGWQSMMTLLEVLAMLTLAGLGAMLFRRRIRRGSALALVFAGFCTVLAMPTGASATEHRGGQNPTVSKEETIKGNIYLSGERVHVEGTVDGDVFAAGKDIDIDGHVTGDVITAGRYLRIRGTVDGNVRSCGNTAVISGNLGKNIMWFGDAVTVDATGKVGGTITMFGGTLAIDGHLGRDILFIGEEINVNGEVGGGIQEKGNMLIIGSNAQVDGPVKFEGNKPAEVAPGAKLASPVQFKQMEKKHEYRDGNYYVWRVIWTAAFILFGSVLFLLVPGFAGETIGAAERYGAPIGLGILVFFGVPLAALIACITVVGLPLGILTFGLWMLMLCCAEIVVGTVIGNLILGKATDTWGMIGRMALGFVIVRIVYTPLAQVHVLGLLAALGIWMWGMGAISLALYKRLQPVIAPNVPSAPYTPPMPPNTTVGGALPA
jgi:cytoskeletal protein CcmA (bactofilin family)/predicted anti-sigma-YlaC factor YlaD